MKTFHLKSSLHLVQQQLSKRSPTPTLAQLEQVYLLHHEQDCTFPFIARYRQDAVGGMCPETLKHAIVEIHRVGELCARKNTVLDNVFAVLKSREDKDRFRKQLEIAATSAVVESLYAPFKPAAKGTHADNARKQGYGELADQLWEGKFREQGSLYRACARFATKGTAVKDVEKGVEYLVAEKMAQNADLRQSLRDILCTHVRLVCHIKKERKSTVKKTTQKNPKAKGGEDRKSKGGADPSAKRERFDHYANYDQLVSRSQAHQIMAIKRGEKQGVLSYKFVLPKDWQEKKCISLIERHTPAMKFKAEGFHVFKNAAQDAWKRLIMPSLGRSLMADKVEAAHRASVDVFAQNLTNLLLADPHRGEAVLGVDPGFRHGCKIASLGRQGQVNALTVVFPHTSGDVAKEVKKVRKLMAKFPVRTVAIGNGTASRQTRQWFQEHVLEQGDNVDVVVVSEAGASVYSTSDVAAKEFPEEKFEMLGAVSIGRRYQDPLSELVKVEPKHLGVGMYQHDISEKLLNEALTDTVVECVSNVGVDVNSSSTHLLCRVAGVTKSIAKLLHEEARKKPFTSRASLRERVKGMGPKRFEQCAGFLTISSRDTKDPLDSTRVHPESYATARSLVSWANDQTKKSPTTKSQDDNSQRFGLAAGAVEHLQTLVRNPPTTITCGKRKVDVSHDIVQTTKFLLEATGQQDHSKKSTLKKRKRSDDKLKSVTSVDDLEHGDVVSGTVTNVTSFGAFVDLGVEYNGLLHVSQFRSQCPTVGDDIQVRIEKVDRKRKRIALGGDFA